jgi:hypothetical protein
MRTVIVANNSQAQSGSTVLLDPDRSSFTSQLHEILKYGRHLNNLIYLPDSKSSFGVECHGQFVTQSYGVF